MEKNKITVGLVGLTNFTKISLSIGVEKSIEFLQNVYKMAGDIIVKNDGEIFKYMGDAILFTFEDASNAVIATKDIVLSRPQEINSISSSFYGAISTDEALFTEIGHPSLVIKDVIGPAVNKVFRIIPMNSQLGTKLLMDEDTYDLLENKNNIIEKSKTIFKGFDKEIKVYEIQVIK